MKRLLELLHLADLNSIGIPTEALVSKVLAQSIENLAIHGITTDSRDVNPGELFIGLPGSHLDGGEFWPQALASGASVALVADSWLASVDPVTQKRLLGIPKELIPAACAQLAAAFYDFPGHRLSLVGVTGTNGKTTTTHLIEYLLLADGQPTALVGTLYSRWPGQQVVASHTTPFALEVQRILAEAKTAGCKRVVMEVSSHALAQQRVWGCQFQAAVWTNLTQDHLDFHKSLEDYWQAKALLFQDPYLQGRAIINQQDPGGSRLCRLLEQQGTSVWTYGLDPGSAPDLYPTAVEIGATRIQAILNTPVGQIPVHLPLPGEFNLANLLGAVGAVLALGIDPEVIKVALPNFPGVPGRMESVLAPDQDITVIVDYAHTPDGLENVLRATRPLAQRQLICIFGCGGDRDRTKRPKMGQIAAQWSDQVVVTSDNPRTEDPIRILEDICTGIQEPTIPIQVEADRATAIRQTILSASAGDMILIAGKGHEDYQILGTTKIHFDDREVARAALLERMGQKPS
jgi:UDP-N-acetylmuramoyl-L-alanyl-D-glutamate--2,6-diaminopimelate ligase